MRGAHRRGGVAAREKGGEHRRELRQAFLELATKDRMQVVASGGVPDAFDLGDEIAIKQQSCHFRSTVNLPRRQSDANSEPCLRPRHSAQSRQGLSGTRVF
jgi:hypothetical protein